MDLIKKENTSQNIGIKTRNGLTSLIIKTKKEAKKKIEIIKVNTGIRKRIDINTVLILLKKRINMIVIAVAKIKTRKEKVAHH